MSSGRKSSVKRHIQKLHNGDGLPIPFVEYLVGRRNGNYLPRNTFNPTPHYHRLVNMLLEEIERDFARKVATKVNKPAGDPGYDEIALSISKFEQIKLLREFRT
jgi:hypothetical protein